MATAVLPHVSAEEYLALERSAETKSSYIGGEIVPMPGASPAHVLIAMNLGGELRHRLKGKGCRVFGSDMRVRVTATGLYTYPDLSIVVGLPEFVLDQLDNLTNPTVIVEVLSPSTESFDRGRKFQNYRRLNSLREYILVSQDEPLVERMVRQGETWILHDYRGLDTTLRFESLDCEVPLSEIYAQAFPVQP